MGKFFVEVLDDFLDDVLVGGVDLHGLWSAF